MTAFLPYAKQSISDDDRQAVSNALKSDVITRGAIVEEYESAIADYCNVKFAVAFGSGSAALAAAYAAANVEGQDRVVTTPNSFIATVGTAIQRGACPVFIDIEPLSGNLDLKLAALNLPHEKSRGKTVFAPVHFAGVAVDMRKASLSIQDPNTIVIEDAAHALGSFYPCGAKVGSCLYSDMTIFSTHPAKIMTTGEGGIVTTNDQELFHRLKRYRNNGIERDLPFLTKGDPAPWYYECQELSNNFNFTEMQGALGLSQLKRLPKFIEKRQELVHEYRKLLQNADGIELFDSSQDSITAFHLMVARIDFDKKKVGRNEFMQRLKEKGIGTQLHYIPLYRHPAIEKIVGSVEEFFPNMEDYYQKALSLPLFYEMTLEDVKRVVSALLEKD